MTITVFLADDHTVVCDGLKALLEAHEDIEVVGAAGSGCETVHQVVELCPDVVVMDIAMPELDGIEATRQICSACPSIQVVILSMYATPEHIFRALQAGARGYLLKESAGVEVVDAICTVCDDQSYLSQKISEKLIADYVRRRAATGIDESPLALLTPREQEVFQLVIEGMSSAEIARLLGLSPKTIDTYRSRMMRKLGVRNLLDLVRFAILNGLISLE